MKIKLVVALLSAMFLASSGAYASINRINEQLNESILPMHSALAEPSQKVGLLEYGKIRLKELIGLEISSNFTATFIDTKDFDIKIGGNYKENKKNKFKSKINTYATKQNEDKGFGLRIMYDF